MASTKSVNPKEAHILVVEDNLQNMILMSRLLDFIEVARYEWKSSGWEMFEAIDKMGWVDLVLMDLHLPQEDGYDLLGKIRRDPRLAKTRVVAITADSNPKTMAKAKEVGFDGFLGKPLNPEKFPEQLTRILQGQSVWDLGFM